MASKDMVIVFPPRWSKYLHSSPNWELPPRVAFFEQLILVMGLAVVIGCECF